MPSEILHDTSAEPPLIAENPLVRPNERRASAVSAVLTAMAITLATLIPHPQKQHALGFISGKLVQIPVGLKGEDPREALGRFCASTGICPAPSGNVSLEDGQLYVNWDCPTKCPADLESLTCQADNLLTSQERNLRRNSSTMKILKNLERKAAEMLAARGE